MGSVEEDSSRLEEALIQ
ncbi:hypothetical protein L195_g051463, partial [Trifolium pratense]